MMPPELIEATQHSNPEAALHALIADLAQQGQISTEDVERYVITPHMQKAALYPRQRMEELWPDAPRDAWIYASYARPVEDYPELCARVSTVHRCAVDWPTCTPHAYVATTEPLELPQVELIRRPFSL